MPLELGSFRDLAKAGGSRQVVFDHDTQPGDPGIKTRSSFAKWVVSLFRGDGTRSEQSGVAQSFIQALSNAAERLPEGAPSDLSEQHRSELVQTSRDAVEAIRRQLAHQLAGTQALTTGDIEQALRFITEVQQQALSDIAREPAEAALIDRADAALAGLRTDLGDWAAEPDPQKPHLGHWLAEYASGGLVPTARLTELREAVSDAMHAVRQAEFALKGLREHQNPTPVSEAIVGELSAELERGLQWQNGLKALHWFVEGQIRDRDLSQALHARSYQTPSGETRQGSASAPDLIQAFLHGQQISPADLAFLADWSRQPALGAPVMNLKQYLHEKHGLRDMQDSIAELGEARWAALAGDGLAIDAELLDGRGGHSDTPRVDQATLAGWDRRDAIQKTLQARFLLADQVEAVVKAGGQRSNLPQGHHVDPFRPVLDAPEVSLHEPNPDAEPEGPALSARARRSANPVRRHTTDYHPMEGRGEHIRPRDLGLSLDQKVERRERVAQLNAELGLSPDGRQALPGTQLTGRHIQQEVRIDPNVEPGRSRAGEAHGGPAFDPDIGSGRNEAAQPLRPRE